MAQTSYAILDSNGATFLSRVNEVNTAIKSSNSGSSAPSDPVAGMLWLNTDNGVLFVRNGANDAWLPLFAQFASQKNLIINGSGRVNQRGYTSGTATTGANQYTLDRWRVVTSGQNLTFTGTDARRVMTAPAGGVEQVIEGSNIVGGTYVLNWDGTATATVGGVARTKGETFTLTTNTNATVRFTSGTFTDVQIEAGSIPTPFEHRSYGQELALCQRYFQIVLAQAVGNPEIGFAFGSHVTFSEMRDTPTFAQVANNVLFTQAGVSSTTSSYTGDKTGVTVFRDATATFAQFSERFSASAEL